MAAPFGGVGHSGLGHSGGPEGIEEYLVTRYLTMPGPGSLVSGPEDLRPGYDWASFRAARERFLARVRPEAMDEPVPSPCPDGVPAEWTRAAEEVEGSDGGE